MKKVIKIHSRKNETQKLKVAAYARVSTDEEKQLNSLESQKAHYEKNIKSNPLWEFAGIYSDDGISGTSVRKRQALLDLIKDCEKGKVNHIITKSISRFSRNLTDCLEIIRKLKDLNVSLYFEQENIDTSKMDSEFMISILSSIAELEANSMSENAKWSVKRRFESGKYKHIFAPYGYEAVDGKLVVIPEEALIIKRIFAETLSGFGTKAVAKKLNQDLIKPPKGEKWVKNTINNILNNEKYIGDSLFQKTFVDSNYKKRTNNGEKDMYYHENSHEAIISNEDFELAKQIIYQRGKEKGNLKDTSKYKNRYTFSSKINCICDCKLKRTIRKSGDSKIISWACQTHINDKNLCPTLAFKEDNIKNTFVTMVNKLIFSRDIIFKSFIESLEQTYEEINRDEINDLENKINENLEQRKHLVLLHTQGHINSALFNLKKNELLTIESELKNQINILINIESKEKYLLDEAKKLYKFLNTSTYFDVFDDKLFLDFVDEIIVLSNTQISFKLKCGLNLKERIKR